MSEKTTENETLIEFPCRFPLKIMGEQHPEFGSRILAVLQEHVPETQPEDIVLRPSSKGNYVGATAQVYVRDKAQLDAVYRALTAHPMVKVVL